MIQGEDYKDLIYTTVEFGYLFGFEGHGIEALMKVVTDKNTVYFSVEKFYSKWKEDINNQNLL